jgi:PAS domain-containing protein
MTRADALTSLVSSAGLGLLRVRHGLIVEANETASALLGMVPQALVGMALHDAPLSAGTVFTDLCELHDRVLAAGAPATVVAGQVRWQRADGSACALRLWGALAVQDASTAPQVLLCLAPPPEDPHAQRAALLGARAQVSLQRMLEIAPMAMALFEWPSGRLQQMNHLAEDFLGAAMDTLLGRTPEQWIGARTDPAGGNRGDGPAGSRAGTLRRGHRAARHAGAGGAPPHQEQPSRRGRSAAAGIGPLP